MNRMPGSTQTSPVLTFPELLLSSALLQAYLTFCSRWLCSLERIIGIKKKWVSQRTPELELLTNSVSHSLAASLENKYNLPLPQDFPRLSGMSGDVITGQGLCSLPHQGPGYDSLQKAARCTKALYTLGLSPDPPPVTLCKIETVCGTCMFHSIQKILPPSPTPMF